MALDSGNVQIAAQNRRHAALLSRKQEHARYHDARRVLRKHLRSRHILLRSSHDVTPLSRLADRAAIPREYATRLESRTDRFLQLQSRGQRHDGLLRYPV
jgi:hypothetical protein